MLPECSFVYPNGHRCGRIPRRGQTLCPAHHGRRPLPRPHDPGFAGELHALGQHLQSQHTTQLLTALRRELQAIEPVVSRRFSRRHRLAFARAAMTLDATLFALRQPAADHLPPQPDPPAMPDDIAPDGPFSIEEMIAALGRLASIAK